MCVGVVYSAGDQIRWNILFFLPFIDISIHQNCCWKNFLLQGNISGTTNAKDKRGILLKNLFYEKSIQDMKNLLGLILSAYTGIEFDLISKPVHLCLIIITV